MKGNEMLFEINRDRWSERDWMDFEGEPNALSVNDLFVPVSAALAGVYFLVAGNFVILLFVVLGLLLAYNLLTSGSKEKNVFSPALTH